LREDQHFFLTLGDLVSSFYCCDFVTVNTIMRYATSDTGDQRHITRKQLEQQLFSFQRDRHAVMMECAWENNFKFEGSSLLRFDLLGPDLNCFRSDIEESPGDNHFKFLTCALQCRVPLEKLECWFHCAVTFWFFLDHYHPLEKWLPESLTTLPQPQSLSYPGTLYFNGHRSLLANLDVYFPRDLCNVVRNYLLLWEMLSQHEHCDCGW
jgi:hypothetical protein